MYKITTHWCCSRSPKWPNPTRPIKKIVFINPTPPDSFWHKFAISKKIASFTCLTTSQKFQRRHHRRQWKQICLQ